MGTVTFLQLVMKAVFFLFSILISLGLGYRPLKPQIHNRMPLEQIKSQPLYLTPYIESGNIEEGRRLAEVTGKLDGLGVGEQPESYSGFLTVDKNHDSNMFFWFIPATDVNPMSAPVVIWLQGGPGGSSLFGLLEIHGPFQARFDENGNVHAETNPYAWTKEANVIYIDNPVGAGFSYSDKLPSTEEEVENDLYEFLIQWFQLFPQYQDRPFFPFGESYAGKFVPRISKKIHDENPGASIKINLAGLGIGDGFMSPPDSSVYAEYLFNLGLVGESERDKLLKWEDNMKYHASVGQYQQAWEDWSYEFDEMLTAMGCPYYYGIDICNTPEEEDNYETFLRLPSTREAIHTGNLQFGSQSGQVYYSMLDVFMKSERETVEFLLERYPVLIYDGNFDLICNHLGVLKMVDAMENWSGKSKYYTTDRSVWRVGGETAGYLKSVDNMKMFVMRNAGHMVPRSQPKYALDMFTKFINNRM